MQKPKKITQVNTAQEALQSVGLRKVAGHDWSKFPGGKHITSVLCSKDYLVQVKEPFEHIHLLSICRTTPMDGMQLREDGITWDELMELKHQAGYGEFWAVEVYPHDDHVVNVANFRHLWILPERPEYAWERL